MRPRPTLSPTRPGTEAAAEINKAIAQYSVKGMALRWFYVMETHRDRSTASRAYRARPTTVLIRGLPDVS
jgi:hypothetical protein